MTVGATSGRTAATRAAEPVGTLPAQPRPGLGAGPVDDLVDGLVEEIDEELGSLDERRARALAEPTVAPASTGRAGGRTSSPRTAAARASSAAPAPRAAGRSGEGLLAPGVPGVNEVRIVGRVSATPEEVELPSGDALVSLRVVVPRPASRTVGDRRRPRVPVDTIEVACWSALTRRRALRLEGGELVEVTGSLRRRFYRAGTVSLSRYEVEARSLRRVREALTTEEAVGE